MTHFFDTCIVCNIVSLSKNDSRQFVFGLNWWSNYVCRQKWTRWFSRIKQLASCTLTFTDYLLYLMNNHFAIDPAPSVAINGVPYHDKSRPYTKHGYMSGIRIAMHHRYSRITTRLTKQDKHPTYTHEEHSTFTISCFACWSGNQPKLTC